MHHLLDELVVGEQVKHSAKINRSRVHFISFVKLGGKLMRNCDQLSRAGQGFAKSVLVNIQDLIKFFGQGNVEQYA